QQEPATRLREASEKADQQGADKGQRDVVTDRKGPWIPKRRPTQPQAILVILLPHAGEGTPAEVSRTDRGRKDHPATRAADAAVEFDVLIPDQGLIEEADSLENVAPKHSHENRIRLHLSRSAVEQAAPHAE